jgi:hypothetical protein
MHVPYALLHDGTRVLPSRALRERVHCEGLDLFCPGPECRAKKQRLILRSGEKIRPHFAHFSKSGAASACSGGEGAKHMACKLWVRDNITNPALTIHATCTTCPRACTVFQGGDGATAKEEQRVGKYLIDVLARRGDETFYLEVHHTHACTPEKVAFLNKQDGHIVEFHAEDASTTTNFHTTRLTRATCSVCKEYARAQHCAHPACGELNAAAKFLRVGGGASMQYFCTEHEPYGRLLARRRCDQFYMHPVTSEWVRCGKINRDYSMRWQKSKLVCPKHFTGRRAPRWKKKR